MKSIIIALVLSLVMVVGASSTALAGPPHHPHHPGFGPVAAAVGFTAAVVGAAMAPPVYAAPAAPVYYSPQPVVIQYAPPAPVYYAPPRPVYYAPPRPVFYPHRPAFRPRPW